MHVQVHPFVTRHKLTAILGAMAGAAALLLLPVQAAADPLPPGWSPQISNSPENLAGVWMVRAPDGSYHGSAVGGNREIWSTDGQTWHLGSADVPPGAPAGYTGNYNGYPQVLEVSLNRVNMVDQNFGWAVGERAISFYTYNYMYQGVSYTFQSIDRPFGNAVVLITTDGGKTWRTTASATLNDLEGVFFRNQSEGWIAGDRGVIEHTITGGGTAGAWVGQITAGANCNVGAVAPASKPRKRVGKAQEKPEASVAGSCGIVGISVHTNALGKLEGWAVGDRGVILHNVDAGNDASPWSIAVAGGSIRAKDFEGLFCLDANNCWAVGDGGRIVPITNGVVQPDIVIDGISKSGNPEMELYGVSVARATDGSLHGFVVGASSKNSAINDPNQGVIISTKDGFITNTVSYTDFRSLKDVSAPTSCAAWAVGSTGGFINGVPSPATGAGNRGVMLAFSDNPGACPVGNQAPAVTLPNAGDPGQATSTLTRGIRDPNPNKGLFGLAAAILLGLLAWGGLRLRWSN